ncbi:MAG TPA: DUF3570 domain-containing protein [Flavitalea sp.]|nr:DUF3570 domain-containing protein [Flavitalea sp.]
MKKLSLAVLGMYFGILAAFSQNTQKVDSTYRSRKLKFEEANIVSSYYAQDGNNAAVTGGIGSQKLTDISTTIDLKLVKYDKRDRKHNLSLELGIDHYTSASSDNIDPSTLSSASYADNRFYPSIGWTMENEGKRTTFGAGLYYSSEYDYQSFGGHVSFSKKTKNRNGEFSAKLQFYDDHLTAVYPIELRNSLAGSNPDMSRNTYSGTLSWSQIINKNLQLMLEGEVVYQEGWLGLPFHRVYFMDNSVHIEQLPSSRIKVPIGLRANYFLGDKIILRGWYRFYKDDWNISSNTLQLETSIKLSPFLSVTPFYRFYQQTAAEPFAPYAIHTATDKYYTSNYDLSKFDSHFFGAGFRMAPPSGVFNIQHLNAMEIRYGHYRKNIDMNANIISLHIKFK